MDGVIHYVGKHNTTSALGYGRLGIGIWEGDGAASEAFDETS